MISPRGCVRVFWLALLGGFLWVNPFGTLVCIAVAIALICLGIFALYLDECITNNEWTNPRDWWRMH